MLTNIIYSIHFATTGIYVIYVFIYVIYVFMLNNMKTATTMSSKHNVIYGHCLGDFLC